MGPAKEIIIKAGYCYDSIPAVGMPRMFSIAWTGFFWKLFVSLIRSYKIIRKFRPKVIFSTGGFTAGPVALVGAMSGVPVVLMEPNVVPGITNRLVYRFARAAFLSYEESKVRFSGGEDIEVHVTGSPVRNSFTKKNSQETGERIFGIKKAGKVLLIFGGSQGSHSINNAIARALENWGEERTFQVIWQTGQSEYEKIKDSKANRPGVYIFPYIENMPAAFAVCDLVLCRAGALTLAELAAAGKPSVLVPLSSSAEDHQTKNAMLYDQAGASKMIPENELIPEHLMKEIDSILDNDLQLSKMAHAANSFAQPDAANYITDILIKGFFHEQGTIA